MRRVRGDGNCFYRGLLFGLLEHLLSYLQTAPEAAQTEITRLSKAVADSRDTLLRTGYEEVRLWIWG